MPVKLEYRRSPGPWYVPNYIKVVNVGDGWEVLGESLEPYHTYGKDKDLRKVLAVAAELAVRYDIELDLSNIDPQQALKTSNITFPKDES